MQSAALLAVGMGSDERKVSRHLRHNHDVVRPGSGIVGLRYYVLELKREAGKLPEMPFVRRLRRYSAS